MVFKSLAGRRNEKVGHFQSFSCSFLYLRLFGVGLQLIRSLMQHHFHTVAEPPIDLLDLAAKEKARGSDLLIIKTGMKVSVSQEKPFLPRLLLSFLPLYCIPYMNEAERSAENT